MFAYPTNPTMSRSGTPMVVIRQPPGAVLLSPRRAVNSPQGVPPVPMSPLMMGRAIQAPKPQVKALTETSWERQLSEEDEHKAHAQYLAWLGWSPQPGSKCARAIKDFFPGALPGQVVHARSRTVLTEKFGLETSNTLLGLSMCPDEINHEKSDLSNLLSNYWGESFPLGGISGAAFSGKTGFAAFSHHVPDGGNVLVFFGPHVGISKTGEIGKYLRKGQHKHSTACGAVIGAYNPCCDGKCDASFDEQDMQMGWIKKQLAPHARRIQQQSSPMAALSFQAYEMVKQSILDVVNNDFGEGYLILIGGIQINLQPPLEDHFLPLTFEVRKKGEPTMDLLHTFGCPLNGGFVPEPAPGSPSECNETVMGA
jgi:hypothetical protein